VATVVKKNIIGALGQEFEAAQVVVVMRYHGLTVQKMVELRNSMRVNGAKLKVVKNSLGKIAIKEGRFKSLTDLFVGSTAVAFSSDAVSVAKCLVDFAKDNEVLVIKGGMMGDTVLDADKVVHLASLPSLDEIRAKIVGVLQAPASRLAAILCAPSEKIVRLIDANVSKNRG
jgi:large subunit ribosomal protein L10